MDAEGKSDSLARLRLDVASARVLVWVASVGRDADLTDEAHLYFVDPLSASGGSWLTR